MCARKVKTEVAHRDSQLLNVVQHLQDWKGIWKTALNCNMDQIWKKLTIQHKIKLTASHRFQYMYREKEIVFIS